MGVARRLCEGDSLTVELETGEKWNATATTARTSDGRVMVKRRDGTVVEFPPSERVKTVKRHGTRSEMVKRCARQAAVGNLIAVRFIKNHKLYRWTGVVRGTSVDSCVVQYVQHRDSPLPFPPPKSAGIDITYAKLFKPAHTFNGSPSGIRMIPVAPWKKGFEKREQADEEDLSATTVLPNGRNQANNNNNNNNNPNDTNLQATAAVAESSKKNNTKENTKESKKEPKKESKEEPKKSTEESATK